MIFIQLQRENHGDLVANTLQFYRERTRDKGNKVPEAYQKIKTNLEDIKAQGKRLLLDIKDSYSVQTVVIKLHHISDRWAMGYSTCYHLGTTVEVPYTIHYADIYCKRLNIKVIVEGEHPFEANK